MSSLKTSSRNYMLSHIQYEHLIGGILGGALSVLVLHPIDLIRTRFAATDGKNINLPKYTSLLNAFSTIVRDEGRWGLYRGLVPNLWGSGFGWGVYFMTYNSIKRWIQDDNDKMQLGPGFHLVCATGAGAVTLALTNPIWVVKTRLCLQHGNEEKIGLPKSKIYTGMIDVLQKTYKYEGVKGLYNGFIPGLIGISHGALHFMVYEEMKNRYNQYNNMSVDTELSTSEYLAFAAASKLFATLATYPYQVVRIRLQDQHQNYQGLRDCIAKMAHNEGVRGFYKGQCATLLRIIPGTMITFLVFEKTSHFLHTYREKVKVSF